MILTETERRQRSKLLLGVAAVALLCHGGDFVLLGGPSLPALLIRGAWAFLLAALGFAAARVGPRHFENVVVVAGIGSVAAWTSLTWLSGGSASPYFDWMSSVPLMVAALGPGFLRGVIATSVASLAANTLLLAFEGAAPVAYGMWLSFSFTTGALAIAGSRLQQRLREAERRSEEARLRAIDDLAVSEHRRLHAEKMALLGKLSSGVAHEINNPLAFVKSNLALLRETHGPGAACDRLGSVQEMLDDCQLGIERIETIICSLRSFARVDDAGIQPCSLGDAVEEAMRLASVSVRPVADVHWQAPSALPRVSANRGQLVQVLVNLLVNAADAIADAGTGRGNVRLEAFRTEGGLVVLDVIDDGPGLPPEVLARLFEPFFTTKPAGRGTGLGLALSREYLKRFEATLEAENHEGGGACFRLRLLAAASVERAA